ncbi:hypothetical protein pqer_cds_109 [Pandoravirus quercus]|uniref:Ankyrin repeat domain-containing protein n=1 Tax=Pandoravirus quercus TaxID=2107709 RepID=A0A2U7U7X6_9VIRU|nr:hypothetical protein pqer_cds_109 [Pandoravirus quercus]AVK74531.1 hypothetical protein pqer_cds_109 [Pandoravirus quercus]
MGSVRAAGRRAGMTVSAPPCAKKETVRTRFFQGRAPTPCCASAKKGRKKVSQKNSTGAILEKRRGQRPQARTHPKGAMIEPSRESTWQGADDPRDTERLPTRYADDLGGTAPHPYASAFDALVEALWLDDGSVVDDLLEEHVLDADDVFAYGPAVPYQTALPGVLYRGPDGQRLAGGGRLPVSLARPPPPTPLGQAVAMSAVDAVDALIRDGARPWPTTEALVNVALATLPAAVIEPDAPTSFAGRSIDAVPVVLRLLDAFPPSSAPDPWDFNPLTTLRMALAAQHISDDTDGSGEASDDDAARTRAARARRQGAALLGPLLARYGPDALAAPVAVPGAPVTLADVRASVPRSSAAYDAWRVDRAGLTERDALAADLQAVGQRVGFAVPRSALRLRALLEALGHAYDDDQYRRHRRDRQQRDGNGDNHTDNHDDGWSDASLPPRPSPWLSVASMMPRDLDVLLTSRQPRGADAREMARDTAARLRMLYAANGCADYMGCTSLLVEAIGRDNAQEVRRLVAITRGLAPDAVLDGHRLRTAGNPVVLARWLAPGLPPSMPQSVANVGGEALAGDVFTTPLAMAASVGALDVMRALIDAGARPWPTAETVLAPALTHTLATDVEVLTDEGGNGSGSVDRLQFAMADNNDDATHVTRRPFDAAAVVDLLAEAFPRDRALGPWDLNPLTVARAYAIRAVGRLKDGRAQRQIHVTRLLRVLSALIDAGYSPHEPTAGPMVRAPYTPSRTVAPTEVDAAVWTAARLPARTLAHALAEAAVGLYAARQAWADARGRPAVVTRSVHLGDGIDSAAWVLVGDESAWQVDDDDIADRNGDHEQETTNNRSGSNVGQVGNNSLGDAMYAQTNNRVYDIGATRSPLGGRLRATGSLVRSNPTADDGA